MGLYERQCPKCKETTSKFHLMMTECDDCISKVSTANKSKEYVQVDGIFILKSD
jgi:hypothetical protein